MYFKKEVNIPLKVVIPLAFVSIGLISAGGTLMILQSAKKKSPVPTTATLKSYFDYY